MAVELFGLQHHVWLQRKADPPKTWTGSCEERDLRARGHDVVAMDLPVDDGAQPLG